MNWRKQGIDLGQPLFRLLFLAVFFLGGVLLGQVFSSRVPAAAGEDLSRYLEDFVEVEGALSPEAVLSAAVLYFRYPLMAALLGFASIGLLLLPAATAAFGFFLSFSVCCFTAAFGPDGVVLALAVFGLRCAVTLPCYFLLAVPSLGASAALARLSLGRGRWSGAYGRDWWLRLAAVGGTLLAGVCGELLLSPWFLKLALERILV